jgi:GPI-anchor transamidase subunit K
MKTLHTDSAYTGFLAAHDNETPMSTGDNLDDHFMLKGRAIARRSTIEKVNVSLSKL